jgi:large subunit ribosomal protein L31e
MAKKEERKAVLERTYVIPLRRECVKAVRYKKTNKAVKFIREFLARHMRVEDDKIIMSKWLNEALWSRGIRNPLHKIMIKAVKFSTGEVEAELAKLPKKAQVAKAREEEEKRKAEVKRKEEEAKAEKEKAEKTPEEIEKERKAEELKEEERLLKKEHKEAEHELIKPKAEVHRRIALKK